MGKSGAVLWKDIRNKEQGVSKKVDIRIMGPLIITKIGCCGTKICHEHHLGAFDPS